MKSTTEKNGFTKNLAKASEKYISLLDHTPFLLSEEPRDRKSFG